MRQLLQFVLGTDQAIHSYIVRRFPRAVARVDQALEALFGFVCHPAFALIIALLLAAQAATNLISVIIAASIFGAWVVAVLWIARSKPIKNLTVLFRLLLVLVVGAVLAFAANEFRNWVMKKYQLQKNAEQPNQSPAPPPPEVNIQIGYDVGSLPIVIAPGATAHILVIHESRKLDAFDALNTEPDKTYTWPAKSVADEQYGRIQISNHGDVSTFDISTSVTFAIGSQPVTASYNLPPFDLKAGVDSYLVYVVTTDRHMQQLSVFQTAQLGKYKARTADAL
ncbi:MAG: hypothetical protein WBC04_15235 [Candidatus Acidiferrales bacterium]